MELTDIKPGTVFSLININVSFVLGGFDKVGDPYFNSKQDYGYVINGINEYEEYGAPTGSFSFGYTCIQGCMGNGEIKITEPS